MKYAICLISLLILLTFSRANAQVIGNVQGIITTPITGPSRQSYTVSIVQLSGYQPAASIVYTDSNSDTMDGAWYQVTTLNASNLAFGGRIVYNSPLSSGIFAFYNQFTFTLTAQGAQYYITFTVKNAFGQTILSNSGYLDAGATVNL